MKPITKVIPCRAGLSLGAQILDRPGKVDMQGPCSTHGPVGISKHFACKKDRIGKTSSNDLLCLGLISDEADRPRCDSSFQIFF